MHDRSIRLTSDALVRARDGSGGSGREKRVSKCTDHATTESVRDVIGDVRVFLDVGWSIADLPW